MDRSACCPPWNGSPRRARPHSETPEGGNVENQGLGAFTGQEGAVVRFAFKQETLRVWHLHRRTSAISLFLNLCVRRRLPAPL